MTPTDICIGAGTELSRSLKLFQPSNLAKVSFSDHQPILLLLCPHSRCNDGSQANYYTDPGLPQGKVLITLQGGGKCDSIQVQGQHLDMALSLSNIFVIQSCDNRCLSASPELCTAQNVSDVKIDLEDSLFRGGVNPWKVRLAEG